MTTIDSVFAREILDSRGNPTIEVEVVLEGGPWPRRRSLRRLDRRARGAGAARRDKKRFLGKGVLKAVAAVNDLLSTEVIGEDALDQALVDQLMIDLDGTDTKKKLGPTRSSPSRWRWPRRRRRRPACPSTAISGGRTPAPCPCPS